MDTFKLDLSTVDPKSFALKRSGNFTLITPLRGKEVWQLDELHLRSVMVNDDGYVVSSGFPKFFNYGEQPTHDAAFEAAVLRDEVEFPEKMDGSLIIMDSIRNNGDWYVNLRTRGLTNLGSWEPAILKLIREKYPALHDMHALGHPLLKTHSFLFEYVAPTNNIVLRYEQPELYFLGTVDKRTLQPDWDTGYHVNLAWQTGTPRPVHHVLPRDHAALLATVRGWGGKEGVVAYFRSPDGRPMMIKIKASEYLALHAFRSRLSPRRVEIACLLANVVDEETAFEKLAPFGFDYEAARFSAPVIADFVVRRNAQWERLLAFTTKVTALRAVSRDKREYVERVRAVDAEGYAEPWWFAVAMKLYDGAILDAWPMVAAEAVLGEAIPTVRKWLKDPIASFREIVEGPAETEE